MGAFLLVDRSVAVAALALVRGALEDLRAARHLSRELPRADRQVLKLIDDAAELAMKATLVAEGIACAGKTFPWLLRQCEQKLALPGDTLQEMHQLRNIVKHDGRRVEVSYVTNTCQTILGILHRLPTNTGILFAHCRKCRAKVLMIEDATIQRGPRAQRAAVRGWCLECDATTFKVVGGIPIATEDSDEADRS